jgi:membrane protein insertase Oxa1/YidC/SpoIIIJ
VIGNLFVTYIYQPFFNILVGLYWAVGETIGYPDMGIAVIIFSIIVRLILLPFDFAVGRSADEKIIISNQIKAIEKKFKHEPVKLKLEKKKLLKSSPGAIASEIFSISIQVIIILMLYRIFATGLVGADLHLLYSFMPPVALPINLLFLGEFDLSHTNYTLNLIQSFLIFAIESLHMLFAPLPTSRRQFISLAIFLPIVSFVLFAFLPAGKKMFIITSLIFSIFMTLVKQLVYWYKLAFIPSTQIVPASDPSTETKDAPPISKS